MFFPNFRRSKTIDNDDNDSDISHCAFQPPYPNINNK